MSIKVDLPDPDGITIPVTLLTGIDIFNCFKVGSSIPG
jgi:hypothetical protein